MYLRESTRLQNLHPPIFTHLICTFALKAQITPPDNLMLPITQALSYDCSRSLGDFLLVIFCFVNNLKGY